MKQDMEPGILSGSEWHGHHRLSPCKDVLEQNYWEVGVIMNHESHFPKSAEKFRYDDKLI